MTDRVGVLYFSSRSERLQIWRFGLRPKRSSECMHYLSPSPHFFSSVLTQETMAVFFFVSRKNGIFISPLIAQGTPEDSCCFRSFIVKWTGVMYVSNGWQST